MPEEKQSNSVDNNENISMNNNVSNNKNQDKSGSFSGVETISPVSKYRKTIYQEGLNTMNKQSGDNSSFDKIELNEKVKINASESLSGTSKTDFSENSDDNESEMVQLANLNNRKKQNFNVRQNKHIARRNGNPIEQNKNVTQNVSNDKNIDNSVASNDAKNASIIGSSTPNYVNQNEEIDENSASNFNNDRLRRNATNSDEGLSEKLKNKRNQAVNWVNSFGRPINEPDEQTKSDESNNDKDLPSDSNESEIKKTPSNNQEKSKSNNSDDGFSAKADKIISHVAKYWKFYLLGGGIILIVLFLLILTTILSVGEEILSSSQDYSSGYIARTSPDTSYKCVEASSSSLDDMNLLAPTPLSKSEFVAKVKAYSPSGNEHCSKAQVQKAYNNLVDHAEEIYDVGVKLGINPEIIFLRADAEGYSPSCIESLSSYYNYYGMGCNNGAELEKCANFSSVSEGIYSENKSNSFFMWILKYIKGTQGMYSDTFRAYAWLYDYWVLDDGPTFPEGNGDVKCKNWGLGACCYSRLVEARLILLGYPQRAADIKEICEGSKRNAPLDEKKAEIFMGDFPYLETWYDPRNKDQRAYVFWQTDNIIKTRKKIFGLGSDTDGSTASNCPDKIITDDISKVIGNENLIKLENKAYGTLLLENGSSIEEINKQLLAKIKESGLGTRKAVVNAAKFQLNAFATYGMKITYMYQGGHRDFYDKSGKHIAKDTDYFYGINPYYGVEVSTPTGFSSEPTYKYLGLDCSGSANWALHNGGLSVPRLSSQEYVNNASSYNITLSDVHDFSKPAQPGDLIVKYGTYPDNNGKPQLEHHTALIAEVNYSDDPYFIIIEEVGEGYIAIKRSLKTDSSDASYLKKFHVAHLDYYYNNAPKFDNFDQTFNDGLIKWEG